MTLHEWLTNLPTGFIQVIGPERADGEILTTAQLLDEVGDQADAVIESYDDPITGSVVARLVRADGTLDNRRISPFYPDKGALNQRARTEGWDQALWSRPLARSIIENEEGDHEPTDRS